MTNETRTRRLTHLANLLAKVPNERLYMGGWRCGTSHCAGGWAALDKEFNEEGLVISPIFPDAKGFEIWHPEYRGETGYEAMVLFFEITLEEAYHIFNPDTYKTMTTRQIEKHHVIDRINQILDRYDEITPIMIEEEIRMMIETE